MDQLRKKVDRGVKAASILNDETLMAAFEELSQAYTNEWKTSKVDEVVKRERAYVSIQVLDDLRTRLQIFVDNAKIAQKQMQRG